MLSRTIDRILAMIDKVLDENTIPLPATKDVPPPPPPPPTN